LVYSSAVQDVVSFSRNANIIQGPPSLHVKSFGEDWAIKWNESGAGNTGEFLENAAKQTSEITAPKGDKREMDSKNISFYFHSVLGIEETEDYALINLAEFEDRSFSNPIHGIEDQRVKLRKVWSEISRFGNLSKIPRVTREDGDPWDTPEYLDKIPPGSWNGLRCIFIVGRTTSNHQFIEDILNPMTAPSSNLHWVLMVLITGEVKGDTKQMLFFDSLMYPDAGPIHENHVLAQLFLYGMISPEGNTVGSHGYSADMGIEYSVLNNPISTNMFSPVGDAVITAKGRNAISLMNVNSKRLVNDMLKIADENKLVDQYTKDKISDLILGEITSESETDDSYDISPASRTRMATYFSQVATIPGAYFSDEFKREKGGGEEEDTLYVVRPGPFLKNVLLQKDSWECGYFSCAMTRHIIALGKKYSLPPSVGAIELSWCAESIGYGGFDCYVITETLSGEYTRIFPLWPKKSIVDENETGTEESDHNRFSYYLHRILFSAICSTRSDLLPWHPDLPVGTKVNIPGDYLKDISSEDAAVLNVTGDIVKYGITEKFGDTLYRITRMHSVAIPNDVINQLEIYAVPKDSKGREKSLSPNLDIDVPWRPQLLKHSYPVETGIKPVDPKVAIYSNIGQSLIFGANKATTTKVLGDYAIDPWMYTSTRMNGCIEEEEESSEDI